MAKGPTLALTLVSLCLSSVAWGQEPVSNAGTADASSARAAKPEAATQVRRDPAGKKGVTPFLEAIAKGDVAAVARDYAKAKEAYQTALAAEPKQAIGHYRIGQVEVMAGKLADAETAYNDALRFADSDPTLRAKLLFALADLKERQVQRDAAIKAWQAYADHLKSEPKAKGYPASAEERQKRLIRYNELVVEAKGVKERTALRIKELDEAKARKVKVNER